MSARDPARWLLVLLAACHVGPCRPPPPPPEAYAPLPPTTLRSIAPATTFPTESHWRPEHERITLVPLPGAPTDGGADAGRLSADAGPDAGASFDEEPLPDPVDAGARCVHEPRLVCSADCWCAEPARLATTDLIGVYAMGGETWAVGPTVLHRAHEGWTNLTNGLTPTDQPGTYAPTQAGPIRNAGAVFGSAGDVWFATGARLRHLVGDWVDPASARGPQVNELTALWGSSPRSIYAVGRGGTALRYDGTSWESVDLSTTEWLTSIAGRSADDVWVVGTSGTVVHFDGSRWTHLSAGAASQEWFTGVQAPSAGEAWLTTTSGHLYRATARGLTLMPGDAGVPLFGLWFASPSDGWAVGGAGLVLHYDGARWKQVDSGSPFDLLAIHGDGSRIWAVGRSGTILSHPR